MKKTATMGAALVLAACGSLGNLFDSGTPTGCAACTSSQVCHPVSGACVATCMSAADCSSASLSCTDVAGTSSKVCTCASTNMCGLTEVCQPWSVCTSKCSGSSDCPSTYTCDTASGKCSKPVSDAGMMCTSTNSQPDNCGYGNVCQVSGSCQAAPKGTCGNFSGTHSTSSWTPASGTGPVIYTHTDEVDDNAACMAGTAFTVTLNAYVTTGTFPANKSNLPGFKYVTTTGTEIDIPSMLLTNTDYTRSSDMKNATMKFTLCSTTATMSIVAGFYFTGGNPYCATLMHQ